MKILPLMVAAIVYACTSLGHGIVQLKVSKPYCLLNFVQSAAGRQGTSRTLQKYIGDNIPAQDSAFYKLTDRYKNIQLSYSYERDEFPTGRRRHRSVEDLIKIAAVRSASLQEFKQNTIGILPNDTHRELFAVLADMMPYYDKIIWTKEEEKLNNWQAGLNAYAERADLLFKKYKTLYGSSWGNDIPFSVALYPIPGRRGNTTATAHANSLCIGVLTGDTNTANTMGVVLHEMCHVLYDEQPAALQQQIETWFTESRSPYAKHAYNYFDEGMATALGNGYAYQYINGNLDTSAWYDNVYIDGFGHALYPLAAQYIAGNKTIDKAFVDEAIIQFEKAFPNALIDYGVLLNRVDIYSDAETEAQRNELFSAIGNKFQLTWTRLSSPILDKESIANMRSSHNTQLIIIEQKHDATLTVLKRIYPELGKLLRDKNDDNFILSYYNSQYRPRIIIKIKDKAALADAFTILERQRQMRKNLPYQSFTTETEPSK